MKVHVSELIRLVLRRYKPLRLSSRIWRPGTDAHGVIVEALKGRVSQGDIVVVSEKALAVARGLVFDESLIKVSRLVSSLWSMWMRMIWGRLLARLCSLKPWTTRWLRSYPVDEGGRHKQLAMRLGGPLEALKPSSEAGIDGSNLPGHLVALPIPRPDLEAEVIRLKIKRHLGLDVTVVVSDSDRLYLHRGLNLALASRKAKVKRTIYLGFLAFILGRALKSRFTPLATPLGVSGTSPPFYVLLGMVELADRLRGYGAGRTVFEMAERFNTDLGGVTWAMLDSIKHYPVVLFRSRSSRAKPPSAANSS